MNNRIKKIKKITLQARDFSGRAFFPGTEDHPFHAINTFDHYTSKIPALLYPLIFGGLFYLLTQDWVRAAILAAFITVDLLILSLLPRLGISFGPSTLPLVLLAILRFPFMLPGLPFAIVLQSLGSLMVIYGFVIEPQFPKVDQYKVTKKTAAKAETLRIVHISDLHMEYFTQTEERVIQKINALEPDLILFSGDFFNLSNRHDKRTNQDIVRFFNALSPSTEIIAVTGSPAVDDSDSLAWILPKTRINLLRNDLATLEIRGKTVNLYGLICSHRPGEDSQSLHALLEQAPPTGDANILLYHSPDLAPDISNFGL